MGSFINYVKVGKRGFKCKLPPPTNGSIIGALTTNTCTTNTDLGNSSTDSGLENSASIQETASPCAIDRAVHLFKTYNYKQAFKLLGKSSMSARKAIMAVVKTTIQWEAMYAAYWKLKDA